LLEIIADCLDVRRIDWRAERLDHFGDFRIPLRSIEKRRICHDIIEAMAGAALGLDQLDPWCLLEPDCLLTGSGPPWGQGQWGKNGDPTHGFAPQTTSSVRV